MSEQAKGSLSFFLLKSIFSSFKFLCTIHSRSPDNLHIEALWKIWRAWIILNCSVHGSGLMYFTNWKTRSILKHFSNFKSTYMHPDLISCLNFDVWLPPLGQRKNKDYLHPEAVFVTRIHLQGRLLSVIKSTQRKYHRLMRSVCSTNSWTSTMSATLDFENFSSTMCLAHKT